MQQLEEGVLETANKIVEALKDFRVKIDDSNKSPGWKFSEQEMRGIPVRVEVGPKDMERGVCVLVRRDTREKIEVAIENVAEEMAKLLPQIQKDMFERAKAHRDAHMYEATTYEEFCNIINTKPGFVKAMWCGDVACEEKIKEDLTATSRCMPFDQTPISNKCVCCGKEAKKLVYWGKAY